MRPDFISSKVEYILKEYLLKENRFIFFNVTSESNFNKIKFISYLIIYLNLLIR